MPWWQVASGFSTDTQNDNKYFTCVYHAHRTSHIAHLSFFILSLHFVFHCILEKFTVHFGSVYLKIVTKLFLVLFSFSYLLSLFLLSRPVEMMQFSCLFARMKAWDKQCLFGLLLQGKCHVWMYEFVKSISLLHHYFHEKYKNPSARLYEDHVHCAHSKCKRAQNNTHAHERSSNASAKQRK